MAQGYHTRCLTHREFLSNKLHAHARKVHEAARCANEQGKFWAFHDVLYAKAPAKPDQVKTYAQEVGLDVPALDQCVASGKYQAVVRRDIDEGTRARFCRIA